MGEKANFLSSVYIIIRKDGKILLQRRQGTKLWCGFLALPAGHIDEGENPYQAMVREMKEELGINITESDLINTMVAQRNCTDNGKQYYDIYFDLKEYNQTAKIMEPHKCSELVWADEDDLPIDMITFEKEAIRQMKMGVKFYYTTSNEIEQDLPNLRK